MKITLNHAEVETALAAYVAAQGIAVKGKAITIVGDEVEVEVSIEDAAPTTRKKRTVRKPRKAKADSVPDANDAEEEEPIDPEHLAEDEAADAETEEEDTSVEDVQAEMEKKPAPKRKAATKKAPAKRRMFSAKKKD